MPRPRQAIERRLAAELGDAPLAAQVATALDDVTVERLSELTGGDLAGSPLLAYTPTTVPAAEIDSLWILAFGYRVAPGSSASAVGPGGPVPPMDDLVPGPTNEALAVTAASCVAERPVPIVAQWEVARALAGLGVTEVISVEPDVAPDGMVTYLSTAGVIDKGLRLAAAASVDVGQVGVLGFADHVVRCLLTARVAGLTADVPAGVTLPSSYDPESGQLWTRSRAAWIPVDLFARSQLPH